MHSEKLKNRLTSFHRHPKSSTHVRFVFANANKIKGLQRHLNGWVGRCCFSTEKINWFLAAKSLILFDFSIKSGELSFSQLTAATIFVASFKEKKNRIHWLLLKEWEYLFNFSVIFNVMASDRASEWMRERIALLHPI